MAKKTKIPPCGALDVTPDAMHTAPVVAAPSMLAGWSAPCRGGQRDGAFRDGGGHRPFEGRGGELVDDQQGPGFAFRGVELAEVECGAPTRQVVHGHEKVPTGPAGPTPAQPAPFESIAAYVSSAATPSGTARPRFTAARPAARVQIPYQPGSTCATGILAGAVHNVVTTHRLHAFAGWGCPVLDWSS